MTTFQGAMTGQRCQVCKGRVRWNNMSAGEGPQHTEHQDFTDPSHRWAAGPWEGHRVVLESGAPLHTWEAGVDGSPDRKLQFIGTPALYSWVAPENQDEADELAGVWCVALLYPNGTLQTRDGRIYTPPGVTPPEGVTGRPRSTGRASLAAPPVGWYDIPADPMADTEGVEFSPPVPALVDDAKARADAAGAVAMAQDKTVDAYLASTEDTANTVLTGEGNGNADDTE